MAGGIFDVLFQAALLIAMDMLLVVLDTACLHEFALVLLAQLELVERLAQHAIRVQLEVLTWIVREARLTHEVIGSGRRYIAPICLVFWVVILADSSPLDVTLRGQIAARP